MTKNRRQYDVTILDAEGAEVEHVVEVRAGDQLRGELEAKKAGLPDAKDAPLNQVSVWVWCAMVRQGLYHDAYQPFRNRDLVDFNGVGDPAAGGPEADPTQPEASTPSGSPSPASTATPGSGSTPTSTTD